MRTQRLISSRPGESCLRKFPVMFALANPDKNSRDRRLISTSDIDAYGVTVRFIQNRERGNTLSLTLSNFDEIHISAEKWWKLY